MPRPVTQSQKEVNAVLEGYRGKYAHVMAIVHELSDNKVFITRDTARRWMLAFGCQRRSQGCYWVPTKSKSHKTEPRQQDGVAVEESDDNSNRGELATVT